MRPIHTATISYRAMAALKSANMTKHRKQTRILGRFPAISSILLNLTVVLVCASAREPIVLNHRWEVEPDLGARWLYDTVAGPLTLDVSRFESPQRQVRVDEAQKAILHTARIDLANQQMALQAILRRLKTGEENGQVLAVLVSAAIKLSDGSEAEELWELLGHDGQGGAAAVAEGGVDLEARDAGVLFGVWHRSLELGARG